MLNKKIVSMLTALTITVCSFESSILAKNFTSKQNVALDHAWTVKFNKTLASNQDFSKVTIKDSKGTAVPIDATINSDKQSVKVAPKENYSANTNYTLTVDGIKDTTGKDLKENATLSFTTVAPKPSDIIQPQFVEGAENRADRCWSEDTTAVKDNAGNIIPLDSYTSGKVYQYSEINNESVEHEYNQNYDHMNVICGLGSMMKFDQGKLYVLKEIPIRIVGNPNSNDTTNYNTASMIRYTNPINSLAEKQIYTTVSNVAKTDDNDGNKYTLLYNGGYDEYIADANGNLVSIDTKYHESTNFSLEIASHNNNSEGYMDTYASVEFLESYYTKNSTNYNLKFSIAPIKYPVETKLLLDSVVGSKFGDDYSKEICKRYSEALNSRNPAEVFSGEFIVDGIKCLNSTDGMFISY